MPSGLAFSMDAFRISCSKKACSGEKADIRLAGKFDLWTRFAEHSDFVMADASPASREGLGKLLGAWRDE
jgi:hypothetical protein